MPDRFNPALKALGFQPRDRVVIFHADDVGMCQATVTAYAEQLEAGLLSSAALMMPCAWAPAAAEVARAHPEADLGVHLTLTSEWPSYRWGPLSRPGARSGLTDAQGYFHAGTADLYARGRPAAMLREVALQVGRARDWGLNVSHIDAHMGALAHPRLLPGCLRLAARSGLVTMFPRMPAAAWRAQGFSPWQARAAELLGLYLGARGLPQVDHLVSLPHDVGGDHVSLTRRLLEGLPPGLTHFILHPASDTPELRAITPGWAGRVANHRAFLDPGLRRWVRNAGIHTLGYRALRPLLRRARP